MNSDYSNVIVTYLANAKFPIKHTRQVVSHVLGKSGIDSTDAMYKHVYRIMIKLEKGGAICAFRYSQQVGTFWYHPARFNEPLSGQENAS